MLGGEEGVEGKWSLTVFDKKAGEHGQFVLVLMQDSGGVGGNGWCSREHCRGRRRHNAGRVDYPVLVAACGYSLRGGCYDARVVGSCCCSGGAGGACSPRGG